MYQLNLVSHSMHFKHIPCYTRVPTQLWQQDMLFVPAGKTLFGRGWQRFPICWIGKLNNTKLFGQQSYLIQPQNFINHNRWYPSERELLDVSLRNASIAQLPRHFCVFSRRPASLSLGWSLVPCCFPWTSSSYEKSNRNPWFQCLDDPLWSMRFPS